MKDSIMKGNKGSLLWVLILTLVVLILAAAAAIKFMPKETPPEPRRAVSRAKVPPLPSPVPSPAPQAMEAAAPQPMEQKSADASPAPGPMPSPQAKGDIATTDLKTADTGKGPTEKSAEAPTPPPAEIAAGTKEAAVPLAPPTLPPPKTYAAPATQKLDSIAAEATPAPKSEPSSTPASKPRAAEEKQKEKSTAHIDQDKMAPFTIQVGAYRNKANADEVLSKLTKKGYAPFIFQVTDGQQRSFYMVRFGHFDSREEAAKALDAFKLKEKTAAVIVRSGMM